jgi:hypothetical protein
MEVNDQLQVPVALSQHKRTDTYWTGSWVVPNLTKRKILVFVENEPPVVQPVANHCSSENSSYITQNLHSFTSLLIGLR